MPTPQREPLRRLSRAERAALQSIANSGIESINRGEHAFDEATHIPMNDVHEPPGKFSSSRMWPRL